jgi:diguanylate cyclase (GGDEF)-like protein
MTTEQVPNMSPESSTEHQIPQHLSLSTFTGSTLEFVQYCNEQFNSEKSFKSVLRRLVAMLSDWYGLECVGYLTLMTQMVRSDLYRSNMRFPPKAALTVDEVSALRSALQVVVTGENEVRQGYYQVQVLGQDYFCAQFEEPGSYRGVLVWRMSRPLDQVRGVLLKSDPVEPSEILEFLIRTGQQASHWLRRLDNTQALLYQDEVTSLYNYRYLDIAIENEIRRFQRFHSPFSLLFIDLDHFKQVNDVHGHLTGSSVLRQVGDQIKFAVRDVDSIIRYGGDEFVVVLIGANSKQALMAAERVRSRIDSQRFVADRSDTPIHITASIGVACCPDHARDKATIIRLADETMYEAKKSGKNRVIMVHNPESAKSACSNQEFL